MKKWFTEEQLIKEIQRSDIFIFLIAPLVLFEGSALAESLLTTIKE